MATETSIASGSGETAPAAPEPVAPGGPTEMSTRERLIAAAVDVFCNHGYEGARVQDIARGAGLTTGAIYANFRGKADLLVEALSGRAREELNRLMSAAELADVASPLDLLRLMGDRLVSADTPSAQPLLLDAVVAARHDTELAPLVRGAVREREERLRRVVEAAQRTGAIDPALDTGALARYCLMLALGGLVARALVLDPPATAAWDEVIDRLLEGVAPTARPEPTEERQP